MKSIRDIDALAFGRPNLSDQDREKLRQAQIKQQKEEGYQLLVELCRLGEYDAANQLANRNSIWGYKIVDGVVMERLD
jgi:hypothetical protein